MLELYYGSDTDSQSQGIYRLKLDPQTGQFDQHQLIAELEAPHYLTWIGDGQLYASFGQLGQAGWAIFNQEGNCLQKESHPSKPICQLLQASRSRVNIGLTTDGHLVSLGRELDLPEAGQIRAISLSPDQYLVTSNGDQDLLTTYAIQETGLTKVTSYPLAAGTGPGQLLFHPQTKIAYLLCQASIQVLIYDGLGDFSPLQTISCPPDLERATSLLLSPDGHQLYLAKRGGEQISCFQVLADGTLAEGRKSLNLKQAIQDIILSPDGDYLLVSFQNKGQIGLVKTSSLSLLTDISLLVKPKSLLFKQNTWID